jgi:starch synthase (maltosyl-transferring)
MKAERFEQVAMAGPRPKPPRPARHGRVRVVIENVRPEVDHGRFPVKRAVGEEITVEADAFADGHDAIVCRLRYRHESDQQWRETEMEALGNDRWRGRFTVELPGRYRYTVTAWADAFLSWRANFSRRTDEADIVVAARVGSVLVAKAANRASAGDAALLRRAGQMLARANDPAELQLVALSRETADLLSRYPDRRQAAT